MIDAIEWWYPVVAWGLIAASVARRLHQTVRWAARSATVAGPAWLPLLAAALAFVPIAGLPIGRWLHGFTGGFSIPLVALLFDDVVSPLLPRPLLDRPGRQASAWFGVAAALLLYPLALGLGDFDPYALGWRTPGVAAIAAGIGAALLMIGNRFGGVLLAAGVAWQGSVLESDNAWDYLIDPVYAIVSAVAVLALLFERRTTTSAALLLTLCAATTAGGEVMAIAADPPPVPEMELAERWSTTAKTLERQATREGSEQLAELIRGWPLPVESEKIVVVDVPSRLAKPDWIDTPPEEAIWADFIAARRQLAEGLFALAVAAARAHAIAPAREQRSCEAVRLVWLALREDPDHARARKAAGWVRRGDAWVWPEATRTRPRNRPQFILSDHWQIRSTAGAEPAMVLARQLEETSAIWRQVYGAFQFEPAELERQFEGRSRPVPRDPFQAVLTADRGEYIAALEKLEPLIAKTQGIYWMPTRTAWFFAGSDQPPTTVHHEATHQLFSEMRKTSPLAGERCGFWAIEAAACFMESLVRTDYGWTLGGIDAGRAPAARQRLIEDGFFVPLAELAATGRQAFQADERLPQIYSQISGLADFFMIAQRGRYREAFVEYLVRIYTGTVDPDTLSRLCGVDYATLDDEYRRHMSR